MAYCVCLYTLVWCEGMPVVAGDVCPTFHGASEWTNLLFPLPHRPCMHQLMWPSMQEEGKKTSLLKLLSSGRVGITQSTASRIHAHSLYMQIGSTHMQLQEPMGPCVPELQYKYIKCYKCVLFEHKTSIL